MLPGKKILSFRIIENKVALHTFFLFMIQAKMLLRFKHFIV